jgi:hypothetical protein
MASVKQFPGSNNWFACIKLPVGRNPNGTTAYKRVQRTTGTTDRAEALEIAKHLELAGALAADGTLQRKGAGRIIAELAAATEPQATHEKLRNGYVYAIKSPEAIKIGLTVVRPEARLKTLQTSHHEKLTLLKAVEVQDVQQAERSLHDQFKDRRLSGEWFRITDDEAIHALEHIA